MAAPGLAPTGTTIAVTGTVVQGAGPSVKITVASPTGTAPAVMPIAAPFSVAATLVVRPSRYVFLLHIFIDDRNLYLANVCILLQCAEDLGFDSADLDTADIDAR